MFLAQLVVFLYSKDMQWRYLPWKRIFIFCVELFFGINVVLVDIWLFTQSHSLSLPATTTTIPTITPTPSTALPQAEATPTGQPTIVTPTRVITVQTTSSVKEAFVPLGSGQTDATDWTDISGALGYIDSTSYTGIKKVVLEATVSIPNGNEAASIRLFNKTDGHPVWSSETSWAGGNTQFLISQAITLDSGNKLYQVQIRNQLPSMAIVTNSRIHITLQ